MTFCSNLVPGYDIVVEWSHRVHSTWWFERDATGWAWQWRGWYVALGYSHTAQVESAGSDTAGVLVAEDDCPERPISDRARIFRNLQAPPSPGAGE